MPLTIEAFTRCAKVLTALVEQGFLSVPELNELRQQAMKSIVLEGFSAVSFKASPMPALKSELAIEPIDETRNRINFC